MGELDASAGEHSGSKGWKLARVWLPLLFGLVGFLWTMYRISERFWFPRGVLVASVRIHRFVLPPTIESRWGREQRSLAKRYWWASTVWEIKLENAGNLPCVGVTARVPEAKRGRIWKGYSRRERTDSVYEEYNEVGDCFEIDKEVDVGKLHPAEVVLLQVWCRAIPGEFSWEDVEVYHDRGLAVVLPQSRMEGFLAWLGRHPFLLSFMVGAGVMAAINILFGAPATLWSAFVAVRVWAKLRQRGEVTGVIKYGGARVSEEQELHCSHELVLLSRSSNESGSDTAWSWSRRISEHDLGRAFGYRLFVPEGEYSITAFWDLDDSGDISTGDLVGHSDQFEVSRRKKTTGIDIALERWAPRGENERDEADPGKT